MDRIRVLLAGVGGYGGRYLEEFLRADNTVFELVGAVDPFASSSRLYEELKNRHIPIYKTPSDFFLKKKADLAVISSPIHTHYPYVITCLENESNVLCEKPVTASLEELDELIALEKKSSFFVAVGFQLCFSQDLIALKQDILDGLFGRPLEFKALRFLRRGTRYYKRNNWAGKLQFEGKLILDSPLQNGCSHEIEAMLFLLGSEMHQSSAVDSVEAELLQCRPDIENYDAAAVRFRSCTGTKILFYTAHCVEESTPEPLGEFRFEKALIRWNGTPNSGFTAFLNNGGIKNYNSDDRDKDNVYQKLHETARAIRNGIPPVCTLETVRPHTQCVTLVQQFPIAKVPPEKITQSVTEDDGVFFYVPNLMETFFQAYEKNSLPSEIGFSPNSPKVKK